MESGAVLRRRRPPRLQIKGVTKRFGGVHALRGVDLEADVGEVHALLGENGAGKSTLMKIVAGAQAPDSGDLWIDGAPFAPASPREARERGVAMIYQELNLCPHLSVLENVTLGRETSRLGVKRLDAARVRLDQVLRDLDVSSFTGDTLVSDLGPGDRQLVEIARALCLDATIIVFDEPTSSLSAPDVERLFRVTRRLVASGVTVLWISHFLDEVKAIGNRFTVLRDGETVGQGDVSETSTDEMVTTMAGRSVAEAYPRSSRIPGEVALAVQGLAGASGPREASFELRSGEILGVFGLVGAGRTEMLRSLYGLDPMTAGQLELRGEALRRPRPRRWVELGVGLLSEDRAREGVALDLSIAENITLSSVRRLANRVGAVTRQAKEAAAEPWRGRLSLRASSTGQPVRDLSGGNQQKVALARLLECGVDILLLDEPTRGIDVGARVEVYRLLDQLAAEGKAILMVSSHLPELLGTCDRIAVMHRGVLGPARPREDWTEDAALAAATGGTR
ncbi:MAG: sugar ABC transporter ATP-binding protein [Planctomycetes bacterium]|nr:sugar ABC transporter ATP-binding protein [Planctomycetota bacterium]